MKQSPHDFEDLLTRDETAVALTVRGYPIRSATLCTMASRGGGPPYRLFGKRVVYRWADVLEWAESRDKRTTEPTTRQCDQRQST